MARIFLVLNSPFTFLDMLILENCFKTILKCHAIIVVLQTASALFFLFTQPHRGKSSGSHGGRARFPGMPWESRLLLPLTCIPGSRSHRKWGMPRRMPCPFSWMAKPLPSPCDQATRYRTPAYPKRTSMSPESASPGADEPSELSPTCSTAQGSCSQPGNKPCCKSR